MLKRNFNFKCLLTIYFFNFYALVGALYIPNCETDIVAENFLLNGQRFQVRWYANDIIMTACKSTKPIDKVPEFDLDRIKGNSRIQFYGLNLPPLPTLQAKWIYMIGSSVSGDWDCPELTEIDIQMPNVTGMSPTWLVNCTKLQIVELNEMKPAQVGLILGTMNNRIQEVEVKEVIDFESLLQHTMFPANIGITSLKIKYKEALHNRDRFNWLPVGLVLLRQISEIPGLEILSIENLTEFDFCAPGNSSGVTFPSLKYFWLRETNTKRLCLRSLRRMPRLENLKITTEQIHVIEFAELLSRPAQVLNVTFERIKIEKFIFTYKDYFYLYNGTSKGRVFIFGDNIPMDCSCDKALWMSRAELEHVFRCEDISCFYDGTERECDWAKCNRVDCGNNTCACCEDEPGTFVADCRHTERVDWPQNLLSQTNISQLLVRNNRLTTLPGALPDSLMRLDATKNDILRRWTRSDLSALFSTPRRRVGLSGNPIVCNCENRELIVTLIEHRDQIEDFDSLTCVDSDVKLADVNIYILCEDQDRERAKLTFVSLALVAAAVVLIFGVGFYYRRNIQVFLFAHGWCLSCVREEELDADRRYDVFLSFCHEDTEVVTEKILPVLDKEYSVCIHIRDFVPGVMIPTQINNCISQSRRTVIVLSRNFLKSLWGILEFRTAHTNALTEGRVRVVMIVLDDVLESPDLKNEVHAYVKLNTYVKFGDPWFWDKLRYALPHRPTPHVAPVSKYDGINENGIVTVETS